MDRVEPHSGCKFLIDCPVDTKVDTVMRPRATASLANLPPEKFRVELSKGMALIAEHVEALTSSAREQAGPVAMRAAAAIQVIADEEAGKYLILLDAARCMRQRQQVRALQLRRCNDHLAKGAYAEVVGTAPTDFRELVDYVQDLRKSHYLDGPNDVDWIFRNEIEASREERLYVDFVETDDGTGWLSPSRFDLVGYERASLAVELVAALHRVGIGSEDGLSIVDEIWHDFVPEDSTRWSEVETRTMATIERLRSAGLITGSAQDESLIRDRWTFPMHSTKLTRIKVDLKELRDCQGAWAPDI